MPENQAHGFVWEKAVKTAVFGCTAHSSYTDKYDIPAAQNNLDRSENVSIKVFGVPFICCGDALRFFSYRDEPRVTMVAIQYHQATPTEKTISRTLELNVGGPAAHAILFGTVTQEEVEALVAAIQAVPPGPVPLAARQAIHAQKLALNAKSGVIRFNPKMDSKGQRRLQCSIPRVDAAITAHPALLLSSTLGPTLRGVALPATISSPLRQRHQRPPPQN
jgi:hypothetical protein